MAASRTTKNYFEALAGVSSDPESAPSEREAAGAVGAAVNHARCVHRAGKHMRMAGTALRLSQHERSQCVPA